MLKRSTKSDLMGVIEKALADFSEQQINLKSQAARDAIAMRIASDIEEMNSKTNEDRR